MRTFTPKIGIMIIVLILIISAVVMVANRNENTSLNSSASGSPKSSTSTLAANAQKTGEVGEYYTGPSVPPSSTSSATPVPKAPSLSVYIYPGSKTVSSASAKLTLESAGNADTITNWYKKKIETDKFNAKSFSNTNTSGNVLNKLSAAKPGEKLEITIKKDQKASNVSITVDRPQ